MTIIEIIFVAILISYGLAFGLWNWGLWFVTVMSGRTILQNSFGKILDALWLVGIIIYIAVKTNYITII